MWIRRPRDVEQFEESRVKIDLLLREQEDVANIVDDLDRTAIGTHINERLC